MFLYSWIKLSVNHMITVGAAKMAITIETSLIDEYD